MVKLVSFNYPLGVLPRKMLNASVPWDPIIGAVGGLFKGIVGSSMQNEYTKEQMRLQSKLNRQESAYNMGLQQANQEWLMNRQYGAEVSGMKNAGLNPATANGTAPATPALARPSSGGSGPSAGMPDIDPIGAALSTEQIRALHIQNERDKIKLEDERNAQKEGYSEEHVVVNPDTGERIDSEDLQAWMDEHPGMIPETQVIVHNRGRQQEKLARSEREASLFESRSKVAEAKLNIAIKSGQIKEKEVMDAFINLPARDKRTIEKMWREYDDNHDLAEIQKGIAKLQEQDIAASSFGSLVNTLKGDMSFAEKFFALIGFVFNRMTNNTSFSFGMSKSSNRSMNRSMNRSIISYE